MKKILIAASEAVPFIKTGGLADVIGALPKYFSPEEYDVRVILPKYACADPQEMQGLEKITECDVTLNWRKQYAGVLQKKKDGILWYFIDNEYYFAGDKPYDQIYLDAEKFAFFSKAVLTVLPLIDFCPDVIQCNDWQTSWIPVFLKAQFPDAFYSHIKTVFTIHNMRFQGRWYMDAYRDITGLPDSYFTMDTLECYGQANPFKGGVLFADFVTTVSKSYAREIQQPMGGEGLDGVMRLRSGELFGIINGIDASVYDTKTDPLLVKTYDADSWSEAKAVNKQALQKELGLVQREDAFLIGMVSRLTDQKGFDLVMEKMDAIMADPDVQIAVQGTGEEKYQQMFLHYAEKYVGRIAVKIQYSERLAHRIYASADAFLMPSQFEPCGLSQLISLHYGTVPMVRETGGLKDTVQPFTGKENDNGTGFTFQEYSADAMLDMIWRAKAVFCQDHEAWSQIARRGMEADFSWEKSAAEYAHLFDLLCQMRQNALQEEQSRKQEAEILKHQMQKLDSKAPSLEQIQKEVQDLEQIQEENVQSLKSKVCDVKTETQVYETQKNGCGSNQNKTASEKRHQYNASKKKNRKKNKPH